jgi:hypothetical protein
MPLSAFPIGIVRPPMSLECYRLTHISSKLKIMGLHCFCLWILNVANISRKIYLGGYYKRLFQQNFSLTSQCPKSIPYLSSKMSSYSWPFFVLYISSLFWGYASNTFLLITSLSNVVSLRLVIFFLGDTYNVHTDLHFLIARWLCCSSLETVQLPHEWSLS